MQNEKHTTGRLKGPLEHKMIIDVKVPMLSESVSEVTLLEWKKKVGEAVARDEILIDIEMDKLVL